PIVVPNPQIINKPSIKPTELTYDELLNLITVENVKQYVEYLSSKELEGRGTGTKGNDKAAEYICKHLDSLSIPYTKQSFTARGVNTLNIIAHITPPNITDDRIIVIGAHFDHLGSKGSSYYPGADDNASGTAGLMAIATALSKYKDKLKHTVSLQFYSAEEWGLIGSAFYTNNPLFPKDNPDISKHMAMINLDMIGYLKSKYNSYENMTNYRSDKEWRVYHYSLGLSLKDIVNELSKKYSFANNISGYRPGGSDHAPFFKKGIPVVFLHTGSHPHYHKTSDTPDKLNYNGLVCVSKLALEILIKIDNSN
ncbi:MAG: hypothetical protein RL348_1208, partial [Bacteroidota bacterium]